MNFFRNSDRVFALILIIMASIMYYLISGMEEPYSTGALAASTYPRLILGCIILTSCLLIFKTRNSAEGNNQISFKGLPVIILVAIYISFLEYIGFFLLTPVILFILPLLAGFRRYGLTSISVIIVTFALYGVFVEVLNIPLPVGILGD